MKVRLNDILEVCDDYDSARLRYPGYRDLLVTLGLDSRFRIRIAYTSQGRYALTIAERRRHT